MAASLEALREQLPTGDDPASRSLRERLRRLEGVVVFGLETEYHERLTDAHAHLRDLNRDVDAMQERYESFVRLRQAATRWTPRRSSRWRSRTRWTRDWSRRRAVACSAPTRVGSCSTRRSVASSEGCAVAWGVTLQRRSP